MYNSVVQLLARFRHSVGVESATSYFLSIPNYCYARICFTGANDIILPPLLFSRKLSPIS